MPKVLLLDGAMGTKLLERGLDPGENPSVFGMENPFVIEDIHKAYIKAGSQAILTNTFSANADKLEGTGYSVAAVVGANVAAAKKAAKKAEKKVKVALDIGPIGKLLEPYGELTFERAYEIFAEIIRAGDDAGADIVYFETMSSLNELRAGILAAKENSKLPVWATMSFEETGRTFVGTSAKAMAITLSALNVDALGVNCSLGPNELYKVVCEIRKWTNKPIILKPNAGLPDPETGEYKLGAKDFAASMKRFSKLGVFAMGGCCGTTPEYIKELGKLNLSYLASKSKIKKGICSSQKVVQFKGTKVVGERINPTGKKKLQEALVNGDMNYIMNIAVQQEEAGADILDVNVGLPGVDEVQMMPKVIKAVQSVVSIPLQIDSSNPKVIEAGLRVYEGRAIVNSVDATNDKLKKILPIVKKYGAAVVGLTLGENGVPKNAGERIIFAKKIYKVAEKYGIRKDDIIIDALSLTVSAMQEQAEETLKAMRKLKKEYGAHLTLGISNISFGLPERDAINEAFLSAALTSGLEFAIINPNNEGMMKVIAASKVLKGEDKSAENFIGKFSGEKLKKEEIFDEDYTVEEAVYRGLAKSVKNSVKELLKNNDELFVVNEILIPALDKVGKDYEEEKLFLPQLINAANAACAGFDEIKEKIASRGGNLSKRGKIILATVKGDIHDIGKNIVKVVLENYGYEIIDLGKDVPPEDIVECAKKERIKLVGLSALMTTTVPSMEATIKLLQDEGVSARVMVGGAVLTKDYAEKIGADYYAKDATASVEFAKEIFGDK